MFGFCTSWESAHKQGEDEESGSGDIQFVREIPFHGRQIVIVQINEEFETKRIVCIRVNGIILSNFHPYRSWLRW